MNNSTNLWYSLILIITATFGLMGQTTSVASQLLPGSGKKTEDIVRRCDVVFTGQITDMGPLVLTEAGASYRDYKVNVTAVLKGTLPSKIQAGVDVRNNRKVRERLPRVGESYIFFGRLKAGDVIVAKLLPATDVTISKVKALVAALPAAGK